MAAVMGPPQPVMNVSQSQRTSSIQKTPRNPKLRSSCDNCQATKVKCSKDKPSCRRCSNQGVQCVYGISRRMGRPRPSNKDGALNSQKPGQQQQQKKPSPQHSRQSSISAVQLPEQPAQMDFTHSLQPQKSASMSGLGISNYPNDFFDTQFHMDDLMPKLSHSMGSEWTGFDPSLSPQLNGMNGPFSFDPMMSTLGPDPSAHLTDSPSSDDLWLSSFCNDVNTASGNDNARLSISSSSGSSFFDSSNSPSSAEQTPSMQSTSLSCRVMSPPQGSVTPTFFDLQHNNPPTPSLNPQFDLHMGGDSSNVATPTPIGQHGRMNSICSNASTSSMSSNAASYAGSNDNIFSPSLSRTTSNISSTPPSSAASQAGDNCSCQNSVLDILTQMHASDHESASLDEILRLEQTAEEQILRMLNCCDCLESRRNLLLVSLIISNVVHLFEIAAGSLSPSSQGLAPQAASGANEFATQLGSLIAVGPATSGGATAVQDPMQHHHQQGHGQIGEQQWRELVRQLIHTRLGKVYNLLNKLGASMDGESRATCSDTLMDLHKRLRLVLGKVEMGSGGAGSAML